MLVAITFFSETTHSGVFGLLSQFENILAIVNTLVPRRPHCFPFIAWYQLSFLAHFFLGSGSLLTMDKVSVLFVFHSLETGRGFWGHHG
jgi:hypothetical protein